MYLLKFSRNGKNYLYHNGNFVGGNTEEDAHRSAVANTAKSLSVGGFDIVEVKTTEELGRMVGGVPFKIISFSGGLLPFEGVEIIA